MTTTDALAVSDFVRDPDGHPRWVVAALFVGVDRAEPRCIDYRVRTVPKLGTVRDTEQHAARIAEAVKDIAKGNYESASIGFLETIPTPPPEGIPRRVFEEASQARLLVKLREADAAGVHTGLTDRGRALIERQSAPKRRGRPPKTDLGTKLRILAAVEDAYATGRTLQNVADNFHMSRSAVRDLLSWARNDASPRLFTSTGPGRRDGQMTTEARAMLEAQS